MKSLAGLLTEGDLRAGAREYRNTSEYVRRIIDTRLPVFHLLCKNLQQLREASPQTLQSLSATISQLIHDLCLRNVELTISQGPLLYSVPGQATVAPESLRYRDPPVYEYLFHLQIIQRDIAYLYRQKLAESIP